MDYDTIDDIYLAGKNPEYDAAAKKLLSSKKILAWILKYCVEEFKDSSIADIRDRYIIGIPETASVPVLPDETNAAAMMSTDRISGERTEDTTITEGKVTFDVRFRAITPRNELVQLIINIEAQRSRRTSYPLLKRAMYYVSRLISSQYGVDFDRAQYGKIKKVYSIWLCMDAPDEKGGITRYRMQEEPEYGNVRTDKEDYDLQQVVMVYVAHARADMENRLLNLLGELFISEDNAKMKKEALNDHYDIDLNDDEEGLVRTMCNLSVGLYARGQERGEQSGFIKGEQSGFIKGEQSGFAKGEQSGFTKGRMENSNEIVMNLLRMHMGMDFIKKATGRSEEDIKKLAEENHLPV